MVKKSTSGKVDLGKSKSVVAEPAVEKHGVAAKAGEVVQSILGTMAGVVTGIGILVTGTDAEKQEKARESSVKVARAPAAKKRAKKSAPARKAVVAKTAAAPAKKKVAAKKTVAKKAPRKQATSKVAARKTPA